MKLELVKRVLELNLYGEKIEVSIPIVSQFKAYLKALEAENVDEFEEMIKFLVTLGLPREKIENMESGHLLKVIEAVSNPK